MAAALALIPQLISLLPLLETGGAELIAFISKVRNAAIQTGAWTPAMDKAFLDSLIAMSQKQAWKTDAELAAGK